MPTFWKIVRFVGALYILAIAGKWLLLVYADHSVDIGAAGAYWEDQYRQLISPASRNKVQAVWPQMPSASVTRYVEAFSACAAHSLFPKLDQRNIKLEYLLGSRMSSETNLVSKDSNAPELNEAESAVCRSQAKDAVADAIDPALATAYWTNQLKDLYRSRVRQKIVDENPAMPSALANRYADTYLNCLSDFASQKLDSPQVRFFYATREKLTDDTPLPIKEQGTKLLTNDETKICETRANVAFGITGAKMLYDFFTK